MIEKGQIKGIIFDLDGTLFDSTGVWFESDKAFFRKRDVWLPEDYGEKVGHIGLEAAAIYTKENYFPTESIESIIAEWKSNVLEQYRHVVKLKPHVKEFLDYLKERHIPFCAATANDSDCYLGTMENNGIKGMFDFVLEVESYRDKSFPDIYLESAKRLGLKPCECMVFEDIALAINTAKEAGFHTTAVYDKYCKEEDLKQEIADFYITDFNEIIGKI